MKYQPVTAVWEVTMGCNMRCKHCGSSCEAPLSDELTTQEALAVANQIADLGLSWVTLSGGEPFTRRDWHLIAKQLSDRGVVPNIISNGWLVTEDTVAKAKEAHVGTIAISLDGLQETHDYIRKKGAFERASKALKLFVDNGIVCGVITTISNANFKELRELRETLIEWKVPYWQVQIGLPMGNFAKEPNLILQPEQINDIIDFCFETATDGRITIYPADCIGYYNVKDLQTRQLAHKTSSYPLWMGCNAGKRGFGILQNGDVLGCTSIRDRQFVEGNLRERSLRDIWEDEGSFLWNRNAEKHQLKGDCGRCMYGDECLGGCPNTRLTMEKDLLAENRFCSYNVGMKKVRDLVAKRDDVAELLTDANRYIAEQEYQIAAIVLERAVEVEPLNIDALRLHGFVSFLLRNLNDAERSNVRALEVIPDDCYSLKGLGITLYHNGRKEEGIGYLRKATELANPRFMDPYYDLAVIYMDNNQPSEAKALLEQAKLVSADFPLQNRELYDRIFS